MPTVSTDEKHMAGLLNSPGAQHWLMYRTFDDALAYVMLEQNRFHVPYGIWKWDDTMKLIAICFCDDVFMKQDRTEACAP